jgi:hypothetical protein
LVEPKKSSELADIFFYSCAFVGTSIVAIELMYPSGLSGLHFSMNLFYRWCGWMMFVAGIPFAFATLASKRNPERFRAIFITSWLALSVLMFLGRSLS